MDLKRLTYEASKLKNKSTEEVMKKIISIDTIKLTTLYTIIGMLHAKYKVEPFIVEFLTSLAQQLEEKRK